MKSWITHTKSSLGRWTVVLGAMIIVALIMPAAAFSQASPAPVNLGTAGDFVVLAKAGITSTGTTKITGDIGISPAAASFMTGFGLIKDASNTFSTSSLLTGKAFAADYTTPTPAKMTAAVSDMQTAYTNAAGRPTPDYTELYSGDVTGKILTRGLYKWGTGVQISAGGVTISGSATDVWIFQIAQNLTVANGANVTLTGGALASNVFWQVAGQTTLGTTAAMKGIILCQTQIAMGTGATLNGRALAQTAVTLDANGVTDPGTSVPLSNIPTISALSLATVNQGSVGVKINVTGSNFAAGVTSLDFGAGITVNNLVVNSPTSITATITLASTAAPGARAITVTNSGSGGGSATLSSGFAVGTGTATSVEQVPSSGSPVTFALEQNYPNPFNPSTLISYSLEKAVRVSLRIYNVLGNEVATLVDGPQEAGNHSITFNTNEGTFNIATGVYFYRLEAGSFVSTKKLVLIK